MNARVGKIARLPVAIRDEINLRLLNGQTGGKILPWLNGLPEVQTILGEDFEGLAVNDQNLSDWRRGGYADWLRRRENIAHTREMSRFAVDMAKASGGNLTEGAAAILSGKILEVLEGLDETVRAASSPRPSPSEGEGGGTPGEDATKRLKEVAAVIDSLSDSLASLRSGDHSKEKLGLLTEKLKQSAEQLELEKQKFLRESAKIFLKLRANEREELNTIADSALSNEDKLEQLGQKLFPLHWKPKSA